ncbi:hypothetical protein M9Y10_041047 [Tritrichomonas musculus]|uniref:Uncharacterized protein n=1 Tax=Tritrichomonas musculus TaxID=1915356 RepID=A0ABR2K3W2_9EUKA
MRHANQSPKSSNILQMLIWYLNSKDVSFEKIQKLINNSTAEQVIPSFAFLCSWMTSKSDSELIQLMSIHTFYNLIDLFLCKASPVILIACIFQQKISLNPPSIILFETFRPIILRFQALLIITHPLEFRDFITFLFPINLKIQKKICEFRNPYLQFEFETDPCFHDTFIENIQYMLLSHAPFGYFEPFLNLQNSKYIITQAVIGLLKKFNDNRKATHAQQLFMFSSLFLYIESFVSRNQIDGQILCEYLRSYPYLSPFCLLSLINHIPKDIYLFNLLIPSKIVGRDLSDDQSLDEIKNQYSLFDLTLDDSLNNLISLIPNMALSYFLSDVTLFKPPNKPKTDSEKIIFIHQCGSNLSERMKEILKLAQEGQLNALHVVSIDLPLLKEIIFTLFGNIKEIVSNGKMTKNLYEFMILVIAMVMPTYGTQIAEKYFSLPINDYFTAELYIRSIALHLLKILIFMPIQNHIIPYTFECLKQNGLIQTYSRFLLNRLIATFSININDQFQKCLKECDDILVLLTMISYLNFYRCNDYEEYMIFQELKTCLINKMPCLVINQKDKIVTYSSIQKVSENSKLNSISQVILKEASNFNYLTKRIETLSLLVYSSELKNNHEFTKRLTNLFCEKLSDRTDPSVVKCPFVITVADMIVPSSLELLLRLITFNYIDESLNLLQSIRPFVVKDDLLLNWITPMLSKCYYSLTPAIKNEFSSIICEYPDSKNFFITGKDMTFKATSILIDNEISMFQNPDVIVRPWKSIIKSLLAYIIPAFILGTEDEKSLIDALLLPVFDTSHYWKQRMKQSEFTAMIASQMPLSIGKQYLAKLISKSNCAIAIKTARCFLLYSDLDIYREISRNSLKVIDNDDVMLKSYLYIVLPSYNRLIKDEETSSSLLCGIMQNVKISTPRKLQETIIDLVVLIYIKLKLKRSRGKLINASSMFPPDLRTTFASSLDIELGDYPASLFPF